MQGTFLRSKVFNKILESILHNSCSLPIHSQMGYASICILHIIVKSINIIVQILILKVQKTSNAQNLKHLDSVVNHNYNTLFNEGTQDELKYSACCSCAHVCRYVYIWISVYENIFTDIFASCKVLMGDRGQRKVARVVVI